MDERLAKVVKGLVKELEFALKPERKDQVKEGFDGATGTPEDYVSCYLSEQIPEREWQILLRENDELRDYWYKTKDVKESEVMASGQVRTTFDEIIEVVLAHEGGFVDDPDDRGGATNWGVTQAVWEDYLEDEFTSEDV